MGSEMCIRDRSLGEVRWRGIKKETIDLKTDGLFPRNRVQLFDRRFRDVEMWNGLAIGSSVGVLQLITCELSSHFRPTEEQIICSVIAQ